MGVSQMRTTNGRGGNHARPSWKIPNKLYADETRQLVEWLPLFMEDDGIDNRETAIRDFYHFWSHPNLIEIQLRGKMKLGGKMYGCHGHRNGDPVVTSYITSVTRLTHGEPRTNRFPRDIFRIKTDTGETYFLNSDQFNLCMAILLWDLQNGNNLNLNKYYYVHPDYQNEGIF